MKIVAFTKSFQDWPIPVVCHRFREIGLDGLDLTVRRGGHVEPARVAEELPLAAKAALEAGVEIAFLTTDITEPTPEAERLLATAGRLGIRRIKLGYYRYGAFGTLKAQLDGVRAKLRDVADMARQHGVLPCVHIHSGTFLPSHGTQLYQLIGDMPPDRIGAYLDMLHMALEGGGDGWRQGLDLLAPWVAMVSVKNFDSRPTKRDERGMQRWEHLTVPVADGISPIPEFVACLKSIGFDGVYSMHSEYKGGGSFRDLSTEECLAQTAEDLKFFRALL